MYTTIDWVQKKTYISGCCGKENITKTKNYLLKRKIVL